MIKVKEHKYPQHNFTSEKFLKPQKLYLPLSQHAGKPSLPRINIGDTVEEGDLIAKDDGFISSCLHSPKKAKILNIDDYYHPNLKRAKSIIAECLPEDKKYFSKSEVTNLSKEQLEEIIKNSGIVGLGGAAFPTHVKLRPPKKVDTLIVNGCECEPYLTCDHRLMMENLEQIFKGVEVICKIIEPKRVIFALERSSVEIIKKVNLFISLKKFQLPSLISAVLKSYYPQGGEKQLIYSTTTRKVPGGKLPFDVGCLVHNVGTCFAIYEAVYLNKPLIERLVSFTGDALATPKNIWVKIGTNLRELFDRNILQFKIKPKKIIYGGPMMGLALGGLDYPILKAGGGFLFLAEVDEPEESVCIRCGRCVDSCPMNLLPQEYAKRVKKEEYDILDELNIIDCIECGSCSYVCPAKIPLVHYIKIGKKYKLAKS